MYENYILRRKQFNIKDYIFLMPIQYSNDYMELDSESAPGSQKQEPELY